MNRLHLAAQTPLRHTTRHLLLGAGLVVAGTLALLDQHRVFDLPLLQTFWPLVLVMLGVARLVGHEGHPIAGLAMVLIGGLMTARNLGYAGFAMHEWWPAFVILGGVSMLWRSQPSKPGA